MTSSKRPLLQLRNVGVALGGRSIVHDVSLQINKAERVGIIGPNGGGKSTLLKAILRLLPYSGSITRFPGLRIGYVPQYFDFDRTLPLTVRELFALRLGGFPFLQRSEPRALVHLDLVGARSTYKKRLGVLSGGELQRVLIALALVGEPHLLILDEPSSALDVTGERALYRLIDSLVKTHALTVIFVSHDLELLHNYASRAICLNRTLVCDGVPHQVLTPQTIAQAHAHAPVIQHHGPGQEPNHHG